MNRLISLTPLRTATIAMFGFVLIGTCLVARAQPAPAAPVMPAEPVASVTPATPIKPVADAPAPFDQPAATVGSATQRLFALQASGQVASPTPRPVTGDIASRGYDRYLKSFEFPIPERFGTTVKPQGGGTGSPSM